MQRRQFLLAASSSTALGALPAFAATPTLRAAARDAWLYGLPLIEMAGARAETLKSTAPNTLRRGRELTTLATQFVTTPNNDTLYARAWIDLAEGPVTVTLPASGTRYLSVALMDMYSNNFAVLGTRTTGPDGGVFTLVGPGDRAAAGPSLVRSPTRWVWLLARTLVDGAPDLAAANAVQDAIQVRGPACPVPAASAGRNAPWAEYFAAVHALMRENPPPATDLAWLRAFAPLGLLPSGPFDPSRFTADETAQIEAGVADAKGVLRSARAGRIADGWSYPKATLGAFGQDYVYRAQVAVGGLAALPPEEAMYLRAVTPQGSPLFDGAVGHQLHFPAGTLPPVDSFWSLTMYEATPEGQFFFTPNPIGRYAIGDRTPGLVRGADGALDVWLTREDPGEGRRANWLPAPAAKRFSVIMRAYLPQADLLTGAYRMPALRPITAG
jgi:hypothetical protein